MPDERTRVGYLIENIECGDADVKAALAAIKLDDNVNGLRNDFERAVALLVPVDPVEKKRKGKRPVADISATTALKAGRGTSGVELRYHSPKEYAKLTKEQRDELRDHRKKNGSGKAKQNVADKFTKKTLRANIHAVMKEMQSEEEAKSSQLDQLRSIVAGLQGKGDDDSFERPAKKAKAAVGSCRERSHFPRFQG